MMRSERRISERLCRAVLRRPAVAFAAALAILLGAFYFDPLFVSRTFAGRDMLPFFLPIEKAVHESWRALRVPLLLPEISFGRLLAANPNTGAFYPLRIAMAALPFFFAFKFFPILHLWIAGVGLFLLARARGASPAGAAIGGAMLAFSGPATSDVLFPDFLPGLALIPWFLWSAQMLGRGPTARRAAGVALIWALLLLAGDVITGGLAIVGGSLILLEVPRQIRARSASWAAAAVVVGTLAASIQIVPAALFAPWTGRALGRYELWRSLFLSVHPWRLLELFAPFPFGDVTAVDSVWGQRLWSGTGAGFFLSLYTGVFGAAAWVIARPRRRLFLYGAAGFALVASMAGAFVSAAYSLSHTSPLPLRYPEKLLALFVVVTALMAAEAFDRLDGRRGVAFALAVALVLVLAAVLVRDMPHSAARFVEANWSMAGWGSLAAERLPAIFGGAAVRWTILAGALLAFRTRSRWREVLGLLVLADLAGPARRCLPGGPESTLSPSPAATAVLETNRTTAFAFFPIWEKVWPMDGGPLRDGIAESRDFLFGDAGAAWGVFETFNVDYDQSDYYRVQLASREIRSRGGAADLSLRRYLGAFGAKTALTDVPRAWFGFSGPFRKVERAFVLTNPDALPRIRLVRRFREVSGIGEAYSLIHARQLDLLDTTVLETGRSGSGEGSPGRIRVVPRGRDEMQIETESAGASVLLLPLSPQPFREVAIDGRAVSPWPANLCWTAVPLPAGRHRVDVFERLPGGAAGPLLSLSGLLLLGIAARRGRPSPSGRDLKDEIAGGKTVDPVAARG